MKIYDCLIIGGGYAGLSAGIYMARYNRSALILDSVSGRWDTREINQNYLGFPKGIPARKLRNLGLKQALTYGVKYQIEEVKELKKQGELFITKGDKIYHGKTLILATGVKDLFPKFKDWKEYVGKSLFWCITCDGYKTINKRVTIIGHNDEAATTTMQFLNFTSQITMVTNDEPGMDCISPKWRKNLKEAGIPLYEGVIDQVIGENGQVKKISLSSGVEIALDFIFNQQGSIPNSKITKRLRINLDNKGYIVTDNEQRTNLSFVYAAGDVTKPFSHQIAAAVHEGATAAENANYDLYRPEQKVS